LAAFRLALGTCRPNVIKFGLKLGDPRELQI
jgi:hypothetical protein